MEKKVAPSTGGNAKQALQELMSPFGFKNEPAPATKATPVQVEEPVKEKGTAPMKETPVKEEAPVKEVFTRETFVPTPAPVAAPVTAGASVISADCEVLGNLKTKGDLIVNGSICGEFISTGKLVVSGTIKGNIAADSLEVLGGRIEAESIQVKSHVQVRSGAEIKGNISCDNLEFNGTIEGSMTVANKCEIQPQSIIEGDVQAKELSMLPGASLSGRVMVIAQEKKPAAKVVRA